jgi:hypothetical protein
MTGQLQSDEIENDSGLKLFEKKGATITVAPDTQHHAY